MESYIGALRHRPFALLWTGLTISSLGDSLTRLALIWLVYHLRGSPVDLGLLITAYSAPIVFGGPLSGWGLDRFGARRVMLADNVIRGTMIGLVPMLYHLNALRPWHLYAAAAVYSLMRMITLAGAPTLISRVVPHDHLNAANALETVSFSVSGIVGLPLAGYLLTVLSGADVLALDALSYFALVGCLLGVNAANAPSRHPSKPRPQGLQPAVRLIAANPFLRNTTAMYMLLNVGRGILDVLVPVLVIRIGGTGNVLGAVAGAAALGDLAGSILSGAFPWRLSYPRLIAWALALGGLPLLTVAPFPSVVVLALALTASSVIQAPLTPWAQTVRMRLIPDQLRGRTFAVLRTTMQAGPAIGGILGGWVVGWRPGAFAVVLSAGLMSAPGLVALLVPALLDESGRTAGR